MNEQDYQSRHDALEIRIKSTWRQVDAEQDREARAFLMLLADKLQEELIELEQRAMRLSLDGRAITGVSIATWSAPDGSGDTLIELPDGKRFRQSGDKIRRLPEPAPDAELELWRQRLANKFAEGAHHSIMIYCGSQIEQLGVPCSVREFHCPHCQQSGSIVTQGEPGEQATTFGLYGHEYVGDGKFYCPRGEQRRIFQEPSLFQADAASQELAPSSDEPKSPWIAYHDQLIREWFDGELALIDDLYPDPPTRPRIHSWCTDPFTVGAAVLCTSATIVIVVLVWLAKMLFGF